MILFFPMEDFLNLVAMLGIASIFLWLIGKGIKSLIEAYLLFLDLLKRLEKGEKKEESFK